MIREPLPFDFINIKKKIEKDPMYYNNLQWELNKKNT